MNPPLTSALPVDESTPALTRRLKRGDEGAWRRFHDHYRRRLAGLLRTLWHGPEEALDDLVQETFLRAVRHMKVFETEEALWCWLTVLARSSAVDAGRKRSRFQKFLDRWRVEPPRAPAITDPGLDAALERMSPDDARLLHMKYTEGRSVREIADDLGITGKAVEGRLGRARQRLREELGRT